MSTLLTVVDAGAPRSREMSGGGGAAPRQLIRRRFVLRRFILEGIVVVMAAPLFSCPSRDGGPLCNREAIAIDRDRDRDPAAISA